MKPRLGLFRSREFIMKDLYTFDVNDKMSLATYEAVTDCYHRIFKRIGVPYARVNAQNGIIGGSVSHEYHYLSDIGEDRIASCGQCGHTDDNVLDTEIQCPKCNIQMDSIQSIEVCLFIFDITYILWTFVFLRYWLFFCFLLLARCRYFEWWMHCSK